MMKCSIIRDLLPSYLDRLTSEDSNIEVENHLDSCPSCKLMYEQMQAESGESAIYENMEAVKPLKKINNKLKLGVVFSSAITLVLCVVAAVGFNYLYNDGWQSRSENVSISYTLVGDELVFDVALTNSRNLDVRGNSNMNDGAAFTISETLNRPFAEDYSKTKVRVPLVDYNGVRRTFSDDSTVVFQCADKDVSFSLAEIVPPTAP